MFSSSFQNVRALYQVSRIALVMLEERRRKVLEAWRTKTETASLNTVGA